MTLRRSVFTLCLLLPLLATAGAGAAFWNRDTVLLELPSGVLEIEVRPEGQGPLTFDPDGPDRFVYRGDTEALVGRHYAIELRNRTSERLKVVVAVDGVNVYWKEPLRGRSGDDVGSVISARGGRDLEGFQVDRHTAQRFLFSPQEWSEGAGGRDRREIGTIEIHVYREWAPENYSREERSSRDRRPSHEPSVAPPIGTTAGEDIDSDVRKVRFVSRTQTPEARATLVYGRPREAGHRGQLGIRGIEVREGIEIVGVQPGTPAEEVGLFAGDRITKIDTISRPGLDELRRVMERKRPGDVLFLEVERGPHRLAIRMKLGR